MATVPPVRRPRVRRPRVRRSPVRCEIRRLVGAWLCLLALGAVEFALSFLPLPRAWRPLILMPAPLMAMVVGISFMEVKKGPVIVRAFAVAALFWLLVLLALGSADPLTRKNYPVPSDLIDRSGP